MENEPQGYMIPPPPPTYAPDPTYPPNSIYAPKQNYAPYTNSTPNSPWRAGNIIYFNRVDPRSMVPKRSGVGITFNFARPISLLVTIVPLLILTATVLFTFSVVHQFTAALVFSMLVPLLFLLLFLVLFIIHVVSLLSSAKSPRG